MAAWSKLAYGSALAATALGATFSLRDTAKRHRILTLSKETQPAMSSWDSNWDCRAPEGNDEVSKASRHLILIRHGHFVYSGATDLERKLTDLGRQQADLTGQRLKELELSAGLKHAALYQSTMTRSMETTAIIKKHLPHVPIKTDPLLCEGNPCWPDPPVHQWPDSYYNQQSFFQDGARIEAAFRKYFHRAPPEQEEDSYEIIVGHANAIRYFVLRALQLHPGRWRRLSYNNCGITHLTIRPNGRVSIRELGGSGHLAPNMLK